MSIVLLKKLIIEMSRYKKETGKSSWGAEDLKKYLPKTPDGPNDLPQYAFTMTQLNKVGVNPKSEYDTPLGVYFYPLTHEMYKSLINDNLPFVGQMENVNLVKLNNLDSPKWLRVSDRNQSINLEALQMKAYNFFDDSNKKIARVEDDEYTFETALGRWKRWTKRESKFSSTSLLFSFCAFLIKNVDLKSSSSKVAPGRRFNQVLRHLGFIGVYDSGKGVIHENEPAQLVALEPSAYKIVASYNTREIRKVSNLDSSALGEKIIDAIYNIEDKVFVHHKSVEQIESEMNFLAKKLLNDDQYLKSLGDASALFSRGLFAIIAIIEDDNLTEKFLNAWEIWSKNTEFLRFAYELSDADVDPSIKPQLKKLIKKTIAKLKSVKSSNDKAPMNFSDDHYVRMFITYFETAL